MIRKEMIALILAGGQGSRLGALTKNIAKPAVSFGGKYKIIDFVLSNCANSGIDTVGVLTQYKPFDLNAHIGIGTPWDLDMRYGGVSILPPYMNEAGGDWYKGTANAVYQNLNFIERYDPKYVLILSGDHIYKMNYDKMLDYHKEKGADATIAVIDVPLKEAKRFGIMNVSSDNRIIEFEEKPKNPKSTLASMGIYIFNYDVLKKFLVADEKNKESAHDFGKNIIPEMLKNFQKLYTYKFEGYWKDIGTIDSILQTNLDLLKPDNTLDLYDTSWRIYSNSAIYPPQYIGKTAKIENAMISEGCEIYGEVVNSIIFPGVIIKENSTVINSLVMSGSVIESNVKIEKSILANNVHVESNNCIGNGVDIEVIGENITVPEKEETTAEIVG